jgi:hypothetical protein
LEYLYSSIIVLVHVKPDPHQPLRRLVLSSVLELYRNAFCAYLISSIGFSANLQTDRHHIVYAYSFAIDFESVLNLGYSSGAASP